MEEYSQGSFNNKLDHVQVDALCYNERHPELEQMYIKWQTTSVSSKLQQISEQSSIQREAPTSLPTHFFSFNIKQWQQLHAQD